MVITVKYLEDLGIEKSIAEKIFAERGAEIEKEKAKLTAVEAELKAKILKWFEGRGIMNFEQSLKLMNCLRQELEPEVP